MTAYFDTSVLISILSHDANAEMAADLWDRFEERVSSILLEAECFIVLQRLAKIRPKATVSPQIVRQYLGSILIKDVDQSVLDILQKNPQLAASRSLDALHLATALYFNEQSETPLTFITLDRKMTQTAKQVGLTTL